MVKKYLKFVLAGLGVIYLVVAVAYGAWKGWSSLQPTGPSEMALHPERQNEIMAQQRADEMAGRLGLDDAQKAALEKILAETPPGPPPGPGGEGRGRMDGMREKLKDILTPEQQARLDAGPRGPGGMGGPGGPGGPGGFRGPGGGPGGPFGMSDERKEQLIGAMTPDQQVRFKKQLEDMARRRPPRPGGGPPPGGAR